MQFSCRLFFHHGISVLISLTDEVLVFLYLYYFLQKNDTVLADSKGDTSKALAQALQEKVIHLKDLYLYIPLFTSYLPIVTIYS